jgi:hypothetical protein
MKREAEKKVENLENIKPGCSTIARRGSILSPIVF